VKVDALGAEAGLVRVVDPQPAVPVSRPEAPQETRTQDLHGALLEPAAAAQARHDDDLRPVGLGEARSDRLAHRRGSEVLVLDIDAAPRRGDRIEIEPSHLLHAVRAGVAWLGAGYADDGIGNVRPHLLGPWIARARARRAGPGAAPAVAGELPERRRRVAIDHDLHVVERRIGRAGGIDAARLVGAVRRRVPTPDREVDAADERNRVVDHHDLLVVRGPDRMMVVEVKSESAVGAPAARVERKGLPGERVDHREVPVQHIDAQRAPAPGERVEEMAERARHPVGGLTLHERRAAVDVPADDEDRALGPQRRGAKRGEVGLAVDQERDAPRARSAPAVPAGAQDAFVRARRIRMAVSCRFFRFQGRIGRGTGCTQLTCPRGVRRTLRSLRCFSGVWDSRGFSLALSCTALQRASTGRS